VVARLRPGAFFDPPADLPRGRHQLSREQIQGAQRVRVMMAFTELLADNGYAGVRVSDIARRAAVSSQSFYEVFESKEACALAAYDHFIEVLAQRASFAGDPVAARAYCQYDNGALFAASFVASEVSTNDYFHPSISG
jgi:AcrR family transcriptional regulator